jgi:hypothetical protein
VKNYNRRGYWWPVETDIFYSELAAKVYRTLFLWVRPHGPESLDPLLCLVRVMVFNATFNNISVISFQSVLLVEETKYPEKTTDKHHHIILYLVYFAMSRIKTHNVSGDRHWLQLIIALCYKVCQWLTIAVYRNIVKSCVKHHNPLFIIRPFISRWPKLFIIRPFITRLSQMS